MAFRNEEGRKVVVVLSSGRSGTSLLMQILAGLGMKLSENLIGPHPENPDGFFEDVEIVELHKQLLADLGAKPVYPLPNGWLSSDALKPYYAKTRTIIEKNLALTTGVWGFKDPRVTSLLPLWLATFKSMWVMPSFILALREPGAAIRSIIRQTGLPGEVAELVWLFRTCDALHNCSGNCTVVHYEDWFSAPQETASSLASFVGLDGNANLALDQIIKPNLNRSVHDEYKVANSLVLKLYDALKDCRGSNFNRDPLMACVRECRQALNDFRGWSSAAAMVVPSSSSVEATDPRFAKLRREIRGKDELIEKMKSEFDNALQSRSDALASYKKQLGTMSCDLEAATLQNNSYLKQIKLLHAKCERLSVKVNTVSQEGAKPARREKSQLLPPARTAVGGGGTDGSAKSRKDKPAPVDVEPTRASRLWKKFRRDPHQYFLDSKIVLLRPMRHLFKKSK